jgi:hypothetical protein
MSALVGKEKDSAPCPHCLPQSLQRFWGPVVQMDLLWQEGHASANLCPDDPDLAFAASSSSHLKNPSWQ